jgi:hypothetical protein
MKGFRHLTITTVGIVSLLMVFTNPSEDAYEEYVTNQIQDIVCQQQRTACLPVRTIPRGLIKPIVKGYSYRQNYVFFSLYNVNFGGLKHRSVGVGGHFFSISVEVDLPLELRIGNK